MELSISRTDFVNTLKSNIDEPQSDFFDMFSSSKNSYKGIVTYEGFELKRKKKFLDTGIYPTKSKGRFTQIHDKLIIDIEMNAFHYVMIPYIIFLVIAYGFGIVTTLLNDMPGYLAAWMFPFFLFHASLMFGIPYFIMKRNLRSAKYDIERDIYYILKDKLSRQ